MPANAQNQMGNFMYMKLKKKHTESNSRLEIWYVVDIFKKTMLLRLGCLSTIYVSRNQGFLHLYTTLCSTA